MNQREKGEAPHFASPSPAETSSEAASARKLNIILVEDSPTDALLVREALAHHKIDAALTWHRDGEAMLRYIEEIDAGNLPCPDIILLDLNLPRHNGQSVLARMRKSPLCRDVPVVIVTSSKAESDQQATLLLGANAYFHKSMDYDETMRLGQIVLNLTWARGAE